MTGPILTAIVIPARNEERRIAACLLALEPQVTGDMRIVIVANNCTDATVRVARTTMPDHRLVILDCVHGPGQGVGQARRTGSTFAMAQWPDLSAILTTDADCVVTQGWIAGNLWHLGEVDAVCGAVDPIPAETGILAGMPSVEGQNEADYANLVRHFYHIHAPEPHNPWPHHGEAAGASLGLRVGTLRLAGGFSDLPTGEDRVLIREIRRLGLRVRHVGDVRVQASCRLTGRAPGGMANALRERLAGIDYLVDECLPPVSELRAMQARGALEPWPPHMPDALRMKPADLPREIIAIRELLAMDCERGVADAPVLPARLCAAFERSEDLVASNCRVVPEDCAAYPTQGSV